MFTDELRAHSKPYEGRLEPVSLPTCSYDEKAPGVQGGDERCMRLYPTVSSFETSPCPSSTGVDGQDNERKLISSGYDEVQEDNEGMPFLARPLLGCEAGMNGSWLKPGKEAIAWLDLFYGMSNSLCVHIHNIPSTSIKRPRCTRTVG